MDPEEFGGRYRREALLGVGGMARVYLARDRTLGRQVAVKVLSTDLHPDPQFIERFRREARSAAGINHPNVVRIYDWGQQEDSYYMVMEYVPGPTLKEVILKGAPLPESEALGIARQVTSGLEAAHQHGLIHRDVKPQNVVLDPNGWVKMTDFGIAQATGMSQLTQTGTICGTPQYISPEQAQRGEMDARSDIYSLGVVLYEMLTGRLPFAGDSAVTVALAHVRDAPTPPRQLNPAISLVTEGIILRAMAKNPAERFPDAGAMRAALQGAKDALIMRKSEPQPVPAPTPVPVPTSVPVPASEPTVLAAPLGEPARVTPRPRMAQPQAAPRRRRYGLAAVPIAALLGAAALVFAALQPHGSSAPKSPHVALAGHRTRATSTPQSKPTVTKAAKATARPVATRISAPAVPQSIPTAPPPRPTASSTQPQATGVPVIAAVTHSSRTPVDTVSAFYHNIGAHQFGAAAALWGPQMYALYSPAADINARFADTTGIDVLSIQQTANNPGAGTATIAVDILEHRTPPEANREYRGYWELTRGPSGWLLAAPSLQQVR